MQKLKDILRDTPLTEAELKEIAKNGDYILVYVVLDGETTEEEDPENWQICNGSHFYNDCVYDSSENYGKTFIAYPKKGEK